MKKLMFAVAAMSAGVAMAAGEITSTNIVGYNTRNTTPVKYPSFTVSFVPVDGSTQFKLGDFKAEGMAVDNLDFFQIINGENVSKVDGMYAYVDLATATEYEDPSLEGWYDVKNGACGDPDSRADDVVINVGQGFLGFINSMGNIKMSFAGEAPTVTTQFKTNGEKYPMFGSYIPREIPLNWIEVEGMAVDNLDFLQVINTGNVSKVDAMYAYVDLATAIEYEDPSLVGWYDVKNGACGDPDSRIPDTVMVKPGDAFLCYINSRNKLTIKLPSSLKK